MSKKAPACFAKSSGHVFNHPRREIELKQSVLGSDWTWKLLMASLATTVDNTIKMADTVRKHGCQWCIRSIRLNNENSLDHTHAHHTSFASHMHTLHTVFLTSTAFTYFTHYITPRNYHVWYLVSVCNPRLSHVPFDWRRALLPETVSTYDRLLVGVTLEKREGACALFAQKTPGKLFCLEFFCTKNAQASSLFSNVTSRRRKLMVCETVSGNSALLQSIGNCFTYHQLRASACYVRKREGACAFFTQKAPDMFTNLPSTRKTLLKKKRSPHKKFKKCSCRTECLLKSYRNIVHWSYLWSWLECQRAPLEHRPSKHSQRNML